MTPPRGEEPPKPRMQPTSLATLTVAALASAAIAWLVISHFYGVMPDLPWLPPATFFGLAIVEAVTAPSTKARIERREGTAPVNPLLAAGRGLSHASADLPKAVAGLLSAAALVAAALWLERSCRVPPTPPGAPSGEGPVDTTEDDWRDEDRADR